MIIKCKKQYYRNKILSLKNRKILKRHENEKILKKRKSIPLKQLGLINPIGK